MNKLYNNNKLLDNKLSKKSFLSCTENLDVYLIYLIDLLQKMALKEFKKSFLGLFLFKIKITFLLLYRMEL